MMKVILSTLLIAHGLSGANAVDSQHRKLVELATLPIQTFFIPFKEDDIFYNMFFQINSGRATAPVESTISLAFSTSGTVVWYDHWEDGFDLDVTNSTSGTTEIWGDGNAANGCVPKIQVCTDAADYIRSGQSLVINSTVPIPRVKANRFYDGGDRLQASFPITITRGAYPTVPGSLMAGATDILETENWGKTFEAPTGQDVGTTWNVFEYTGLFFMAANDNTTVTLPNKTKIVLDRGGSASVRVNQGAVLEASDIIQVHLITGDIMSFYEMRWYSLLPNEAWSNSYLSPVGDSHGRTKVFVYNPGTTALDISWDYLVAGVKKTLTRTVAPKKSAWTDVIPTDSGALVKANKNFVALSLTDTENRTATGQLTFSEWYDWGFTVIPVNLLTPQVLVGWGYACTNNNCFGQKDRSVVWVTPVADCDIYIDYNNTGGDYAVFPRKALTSSKFVDKDQDMSGALLFATLPGSGPTGKQVDIAAAWGQDPSVSRDMQSISLDLGTVIRPFPNVRATKSVDKPTAAPGETLIYTIKVMNAGQIDIPGGSMTVFDKLDSAVSYVAGSTVITYNTAGDVLSSAVADSSSPGTPFPLDATGYSIRVPLPKRGGSLDIVFSVLVTGVVNSTEVVNTGHVKPNIGENINFEATTTLIFDPRVVIDNKVYLGSDDGKQCGTDVPQEFVEDIKGAGVVYCFNVTNTGNTHLANLTLDNIPLVYKNTSMGLLAPGNSTMVYLKSKINVGLLNMANVTGTPVFYTGSAIAGLPKVSAKDPSEVRVLIPAPSISIDNEVALGADGSVCGTDVTSEFVEDFVGKDVTYCFNIINTGNTYLDSVAVANTELVFSNSSTGPLMPGESRMVVVKGLIDSALLNNATVVANPVFKDGTDIPDLADVFDSDPSSVGILTRPGDPREIFKPPSSPPGNKTCMDNSYTEAHNVSDQLVCTTNEVYLEKVDSIVAKTCEAGQVITVDVDGSIRFTSARYDLGWYVATDGGDALDGSCAVNGLQKQASYSVVERPGSTKVVGSVNWGKDAKGTLDACGDISTTTAGAGGNIDTPVMVSLSVVCEDENKDGKMDVAICFTWRTSGTDDICTIDRNDPLTKGSLADLYPGEVKGCYCERYNLPNITVVPPTSVVPPC